MEEIPFKAIQAYRAETFHFRPGLQLTSREEAVDYVNERGFIHFWPIRDVLLPSLWGAVAGDRPVADAHDDPGHVTWDWKDSLLGSDRWYYAKVLRKKATMIATHIVPYFYALSENYGSPEDDHLTLYEQGRMTQEAKSVYQSILDNGPLDTIALRKAARLSSPESEGRFNKAITDLQAGFLLVPVAVTRAGAWHYAFAYDIVTRHYPEIPEKARYLGELDARRELVRLYLLSVGAARLRDVTMLFGWRPAEADAAIQYWVKAGLLLHTTIEDLRGEWYVLRQIIIESSE